MRLSGAVVIMLLLALLLQGCGHKGPLFLPSPPHEVQPAPPIKLQPASQPVPASSHE
jgi:predicted small lipoprotein YifL